MVSMVIDAIMRTGRAQLLEGLGSKIIVIQKSQFP